MTDNTGRVTVDVEELKRRVRADIERLEQRPQHGASRGTPGVEAPYRFNRQFADDLDALISTLEEVEAASARQAELMATAEEMERHALARAQTAEAQRDALKQRVERVETEAGTDLLRINNQLNTAQARIRELEEGLGPFAYWCNEYLLASVDDDFEVRGELQAAHFRCARSLLTSPQGGGEP